MPKTDRSRTKHLGRLGIGVVAALLGQVALVAPPARSSSAVHVSLWNPPSSPTVVKPVSGWYQQGAAAKLPPKTSTPYQAPKVTLPSASSVDVALGARSASPFVASSAPSGPPGPPSAINTGINTLSHVGTSPVYISADSPQSPSNVRVRFAAQPTVAAAGLHGLLLSVARNDGSSAAGHVAVAVDTKALAGLYGGDFAHRLELVQVPLCTLTTPQLVSCRGDTPVKAAYDSGTGRLTADITVPAVPAVPAATAATTSGSAEADAGAVAIATMNVPAGSAGTYRGPGSGQLAERLTASIAAGGDPERAVAALGELGVDTLPPRILQDLHRLAEQDQRIVRSGAEDRIIREDEQLRDLLRQLLKTVA